jgi:hypothetical protein
VKTFADVKGCPDAKAELEEVVAFLKHPDRFTRCEPPTQPCICTEWPYAYAGLCASIENTLTLTLTLTLSVI